MFFAVALFVGQAFADERTLGSTSYNAETKVLTVNFSDKTTYTYEAVPQDVVDAMESAESKGEYFNKNIRDKYTAKKVE